MTIVIEPLQIVKRIVIARNDVIAVRAMPVAQRRMHRRLATIVRALADDGAQSCPPAMGHGQACPAVAGVPAHMHLHPTTPCRQHVWPNPKIVSSSATSCVESNRKRERITGGHMTSDACLSLYRTPMPTTSGERDCT